MVLANSFEFVLIRITIQTSSMRKAFYLYSSLLLVLFLASCSKEQSAEIGTEPPVASGSLKMKIDGSQWVADQVVAASIIAGFINVTGKGKDGKTFIITLTDTIATSYVINQNSIGVAALSDSLEATPISYTSNQGADSLESGGTVTISSIDKINKTISGTFKMRLFRSSDSKHKVITEGVIDKLTYTSLLQEASKTDTFKVKINNTDWTGRSITGYAFGGGIAINATELDVSKSVGLTMPQNITAGTYDMEMFGKYSAQYNPSLTSYLVADTGKLTIIEHNTLTKRIRGNFNFTAIDLLSPASAQLTLGYFSVVYQ